ncbi:hypothetical protein GCM10027174_09550 [Salinifilum aidingensis]
MCAPVGPALRLIADRATATWTSFGAGVGLLVLCWAPGVPTVGNVHEVTHAHNAQARVAYVGWEAIARHHARHILGDEARVCEPGADVCEPGAVLAAPGWRGCGISRVRWR